MDDVRGSTAHQSYAFVCTRCGHAWEQRFDVEWHTDAEGRRFPVYRADGAPVPPPFRQLVCENCGSTTVRVLRPGRVATARAHETSSHRR